MDTLDPGRRTKILSGFRLTVTLSVFVVVLVAALSLLSFALVSRIFDRLGPALHDDLSWKARRGAVDLASRAELGIVVRDEAVISQAFGGYERDRDVLAIVVVDPAGVVLARRGRVRASDASLFRGRHRTVHETATYMSAFSEASIEGSVVGRVAVVVSKGRLEAGQRLRRELLGVSAAGSVAALLLSLLFVYFRIGPILRVTRDAFESLEERTEAALAAARAKSQFLANMSHEIRTPMNGIIGMSEILLRSEPDEKRKRQLETIHRSAAALLTILNDVLDLSRIDAGKVELRPRDFDLEDLLSEVLELHRPAARGKGFDVSLEVAPQVPSRVHADADRIRQVVGNLVGNAVKFTEKGGVAVRVQFESRGRLRVEVEDSGIGIPPEHRARIFDAFEQADATFARRYGGTGLGLAISRELVTRMGGEVGVDSEVGRGSRFWFVLPVGEAKPAGTRPSISLAAIERPDTAGAPRLLVAEDNEVNVALLRELLADLGYEADWVSDGQGAVDAWAKGGYGAILMDCQMPNVDGYEAARRIRAAEKDGARIPIVAVTAHALEDEREAALAAGMDDWLTKPIGLERLRAVLDRSAPRPPRPPLDPSVARSPRVVEVFLRHAPDQVEKVAAAVSKGDAAALREDAHRLKGSCLSMGASEMAARASALESLGKEGRLDDAARLVDALRTDFERVRTALGARAA